MYVNYIPEGHFISLYLNYFDEQRKKKTTDDKHDTHSNHEFNSAKSMTLMFDFYDVMRSLL